MKTSTKRYTVRLDAATARDLEARARRSGTSGCDYLKRSAEAILAGPDRSELVGLKEALASLRGELAALRLRLAELQAAQQQFAARVHDFAAPVLAIVQRLKITARPRGEDVPYFRPDDLPPPEE